MTKLYVADTDQLADPELFAKFYQKVPKHRQKKIDAMKFPKGKRQCLGAWLLLVYGLKEAGIDTGDLRLSYGPLGKPFLTDHPELFFNLSHSGSRVFCAISGREVGCDVERIRTADLSVINRFFAPQERLAIINAPLEEKNALLFRYWTLKESFIKNVGRGLSMPLWEFSINFSGDGISIDQQFLTDALYFREFDLPDGYCYACCAREPEIDDIQLVHVSALDSALEAHDLKA